MVYSGPLCHRFINSFNTDNKELCDDSVDYNYLRSEAMRGRLHIRCLPKSEVDFKGNYD